MEDGRGLLVMILSSIVCRRILTALVGILSISLVFATSSAVHSQTAPPSPAPSFHPLTVSAPEDRVIVAPSSSPASSGFHEREQLLTEGLNYQKKRSAIGIAGRSRQATLLFELRANPLPSQRPGLPTFARANALVNFPSGGFTKESGLPNPYPRGVGPLVPPVPSQPVVEISKQFLGDGGQEVAPPDMQLSVGKRYILQLNNTNLTVWDKTDTTVPKQLWPISSSVFQLPDDTYAGDPWIVYDASSNRWFMSAMITNYKSGAEWFEIAVSRQDDPLGSWSFRKITFPDEITILRDQPKLSVTQDKVLIGWDEFTHPPQFDVKIGGNWMAVSKGSLISGSDNFTAFPAYAIADKCLPEPIPVRDTSSNSEGVILSAAAPAARADCNDTVPAPTAYRANLITGLSIVGIPPNLQVSKRHWVVDPYSAPDNAPQHGSQQKLYTGDTRIVSAFRRGDRLYAAGNDSCTVSVSCFRVLDLDLADPSSRPVEDFDVALGQRYLFYPSIAMDVKGDLVAVASQVRFDGFLGAVVFDRLAGREHTLDWGITTISTSSDVALDCPQQGWSPTITRVGDYAGADIDPVTPNVVWVSTGIAPAALPSADTEYDSTQCPQASIIGQVLIQ